MVKGKVASGGCSCLAGALNSGSGSTLASGPASEATKGAQGPLASGPATLVPFFFFI